MDEDYWMFDDFDPFLEDYPLDYFADDVYGAFVREDEEENQRGISEEDGDTDDDVQIIGTRVQGSVDPPASSVRLEDSVEVGKCAATGKGYLNSGNEGSSTQCSQEDLMEMHGLICSICMEPWTSEGEHHISCLPCGHLFGLSCITKWIKQQGRASKCPQCNKRCVRKDVRKLFTSTIATVDEESQKRIRSLESKCGFLEKQVNEWCRKASEWKKEEVKLRNQVHEFAERNRYLEQLSSDLRRGKKDSVNDVRSRDTGNDHVRLNHYKHLSEFGFLLKVELQVDYGRLLDINSSGQLLLAQRLRYTDSSHVLTKINLESSHIREVIYLPADIKFVKDIHISPNDAGVVLCATLAKKLLVVSAESKSVILAFELPVPAWSCSWDRNSSFYAYAGLQNGFVLVFDLRQTSGPVETHCGVSTNPVHTIHSMLHDPTLRLGVRSVLSASSSGFCQWNFDGCCPKPSWVHETPTQEVCISLAYNASRNDVVASYRPRADCLDGTTLSQPVSTQAMNRGIQGFHRYMSPVEGSYQQLGDTRSVVSDVRLPRSVIVERENQNPLFACGDETSFGLLLRELPGFTKSQYLKPHQRYICDVKYSYGFLCSLSEDRLQIYRN